MLFIVLTTLLKILSTTVPLLLAVAFFTVAERKIMGAIQRRRGPNVIGFVLAHPAHHDAHASIKYGKFALHSPILLRSISGSEVNFDA